LIQLPRLRVCGALPPLLRTSSWHGEQAQGLVTLNTNGEKKNHYFEANYNILGVDITEMPG